MRALFFIVAAIMASVTAAWFFLILYGRVVKDQNPGKKSRVKLTEDGNA